MGTVIVSLIIMAISLGIAVRAARIEHKHNIQMADVNSLYPPEISKLSWNAAYGRPETEKTEYMSDMGFEPEDVWPLPDPQGNVPVRLTFAEKVWGMTWWDLADQIYLATLPVYPQNTWQAEAIEASLGGVPS